MSIIEKGLKEKVRFNVNGNNTIEDLYDYNSDTLANLGGKLYEQVKQFTTTDNPFKTSKKTKSQERLQLQYDIVKYLYEIKLSEEELAASLNSIKDEEQELLAIAAMQQQEELRKNPDLVKQRLSEIQTKKAQLKS
jgi:hypothetical protein